MLHHEIEHNGRLAVFRMAYLGQWVVTASGYLVAEEEQARLYLVSFSERRLVPPQRFGHVGAARFAKALGATHLVPVDHGMAMVHGRVEPSAFDGGFVPCLKAASLDELEAKLAKLDV
jgi:hypothetical protein